MDKVSAWQKELARLGSIIKKTRLVKTVKWGVDVYTHKGKNVIGLTGFRDYFALWFYNGVFLKDKHHLLVNAQEGKTKALRQWRFYSMEDVNEELILEYIEEAVKNEEAGKVWKPEKTRPLQIPEDMASVFSRDKKLKDAFASLTPYKQKEYSQYIEEAKREDTRLKRLEKIKPMILKGVGLNDQYKDKHG